MLYLLFSTIKIPKDFSLELFLLAACAGLLIYEFWYKKRKIIQFNTDILKGVYVECFLQEIYNEYLRKKLPKVLNSIRFDGENLSNAEELIKVLNGIKEESFFLKFSDKKYYDSLSRELQKLEDKLIVKEVKMSLDDYEKFMVDINDDIERIYLIILSKCTGKKIKYD